MPVPKQPPDLGGRDYAHRLIDFLWDRVHISAGAFVLVAISMLFTLSVWKIDTSQIQQIAVVDHGVCKVISGADKGIGQTRKRLRVAIQHDQQLSEADTQAANAISIIEGITPTASQKAVVHSWLTQARINSQSARDLQAELKSVRPIKLPGCPT